MGLHLRGDLFSIASSDVQVAQENLRSIQLAVLASQEPGKVWFGVVAGERDVVEDDVGAGTGDKGRAQEHRCFHGEEDRWY